jgi:hypothetical protein
MDGGTAEGQEIAARAMFVTQKHLSRRAMLKGAGATIALPVLDAMVPAGRSVVAAVAAPKTRLVCIEMVHGAAGSTDFGVQRNLWAPAAVGRDFDLVPTSLAALEPFRDYLTIVSNTDVANAEPFEAREIGGDHFRSSAVFLTQAHPKRAEGSAIRAGVSLDQLHAQRFGQSTPLPSLQLSIEAVDSGGGCAYGYSCAYVDTISWASPTKPLPMIRDPRVAFNQLFHLVGADTGDLSILDWVVTSAARLRQRLGAPDRVRLDDYLDNVREIERRLQNVERYNRSGEPRAFPEAPTGVPDSFSEHVKLMFDLQLLAFTSDITRVVSFKLGRDASNRIYPESGFSGPFHATSHHGEKEARILEFAKLNTYHVGLVAYFLAKLKSTSEADGTLLDNTVLLYGSPLGDSHLHNHKRVPFFMAGRGAGQLKGGLHLKAANRTPLANVMLGLLHTLGHEDLAEFGDSQGPFGLNTT